MPHLPVTDPNADQSLIGLLPPFKPSTPASPGPTPILQVTGDVLRISTRIGGPVLPGFGPSIHAYRAAAPADAQAQRRRQLPQAAMDYLMPPEKKNTELASQVGGFEVLGGAESGKRTGDRVQVTDSLCLI